MSNSSMRVRGEALDYMLEGLDDDLKNSQELEKLNAQVSDVNQSFFDRLSKRFPGLTKRDQHLAALIRINLSVKQIAVINNMSMGSVKVARSRLRKKMGLHTEDNFNRYLKKV